MLMVTHGWSCSDTFHAPPVGQLTEKSLFNRYFKTFCSVPTYCSTANQIPPFRHFKTFESVPTYCSTANQITAFRHFKYFDQSWPTVLQPIKSQLLDILNILISPDLLFYIQSNQFIFLKEKDFLANQNDKEKMNGGS